MHARLSVDALGKDSKSNSLKNSYLESKLNFQTEASVNQGNQLSSF